MSREGRAPVDVCLVLEGTYPFVPGGVSSWVHHLVTKMPELSFGLLHVSPSPGFYEDGPAYETPDNVCFLEEVHLTKPAPATSGRSTRAVRRAIDTFWAFAASLRDADDPRAFARCAAALQRLGSRCPDPHEFMLTESSWDALVALYRREAPQESFLSFFWSWLFAYEPLLNALSTPIPPAHVYHTISTGYAGVLAAAAACATQRPMLLTEHGIYAKERRIEVHAASWIKDWMPEEFFVEESTPYFQGFWNRHFEAMSRICYSHAAEIFTLYMDNMRAQIRDGANPDRVRVIPNGVAVDRLSEAYERWVANGSPRDSRFTVAFVGRVCPIKDVRTFLAAMRLVVQKVPSTLVRILGPMTEDPEYAEGCQRFAHELGLGELVRFEGRVSILEELPGVDVVVLTSISEAQPLVVLEAGALGIPIVTTDVGSCRELLEGTDTSDRAFGAGGLLTPIMSPGATARAVLTLHDAPELRERFGRNLQNRVRALYDQRDMVEAYRKIYTSHAMAGTVG